jgi:hypothetical protein
MTCVWDGLISSLKLPLRPTEFVTDLKKRNCLTPEIIYKINGIEIPINAQQLNENYQAIESLSVASIGGGYLCSPCDPIFFLVSKLFNISIKHKYLTCTAEYICPIVNCRHMNYQSNNSHFWFVNSQQNPNPIPNPNPNPNPQQMQQQLLMQTQQKQLQPQLQHTQNAIANKTDSNSDSNSYSKSDSKKRRHHHRHHHHRHHHHRH